MTQPTPGDSSPPARPTQYPPATAGTLQPFRSLTVIIPTCGRPASLLRALHSLAAADRSGVDLEVRVADNACDPTLPGLLAAAGLDLNLTYVAEPQRGKAYALNRAIRSAPLREITAVLDDDMTVDKNWVRGVLTLSNRWPNAGFYTGRSCVAWPPGPIPAWAARPSYLWGWAFSVFDLGTREEAFHPHQWASGNHFWFRSATLPPEWDFAAYDLAGGEAIFMLHLQKAGFGGAFGPAALAWHHIQPDLLQLPRLRRRAFTIGRLLVLSRVVGLGAAHPKIHLLARWPWAALPFCLSAAGATALTALLARPFAFFPPAVHLEMVARLRSAAFQEYSRLLRDKILGRPNPLP